MSLRVGRSHFFPYDAQGYRYLTTLLPRGEVVWFLAEDKDQKKTGSYWLYEGKVGAFSAVIAELPAFEYYLIGKDYSWLLCENHHGVLIGVGQLAIERLQSFALREGQLDLS